MSPVLHERHVIGLQNKVYTCTAHGIMSSIFSEDVSDLWPVLASALSRRRLEHL
jgi:hypothetical protein